MLKCGGFLVSSQFTKIKSRLDLKEFTPPFYSTREQQSSPHPLKLAFHRYSVGITKRKTLWYSGGEKWRYHISIEHDLCAIMWQRLAESTQLLIVWSRPEKQQDHMSLERGIYGHISARRNSSWSRPIIWMEWMSSLCGYPLCQWALCHILRCAPCLFCLSLHYSIP